MKGKFAAEQKNTFNTTIEQPGLSETSSSPLL